MTVAEHISNVCRISGVSFSRVHSGTMQVTIVATVFQETLESCASTLRRTSSRCGVHFSRVCGDIRLAVSVEYVVAPAWTQYLRQWWSIPHYRQLWVTQFRSCSLCCASSRNGVHLSIVCGERSSWRQLRSRVVVSGVLARCLSASATQQGKFGESSVMEHFLRAPAATAVAAAETLRRHTLRLLLRQQ